MVARSKPFVQAYPDALLMHIEMYNPYFCRHQVWCGPDPRLGRVFVRSAVLGIQHYRPSYSYRRMRGDHHVVRCMERGSGDLKH